MLKPKNRPDFSVGSSGRPDRRTWILSRTCAHETHGIHRYAWGAAIPSLFSLPASNLLYRPHVSIITSEKGRFALRVAREALALVERQIPAIQPDAY